jgi:hypothetical protein
MGVIIVTAIDEEERRVWCSNNVTLEVDIHDAITTSSNVVDL